MQIQFADRLPAGDYALVLPVAGKDRTALGPLGEDREAVEAAMDRQRFDGEASTAIEHFLQSKTGFRRLLVVGTGNGSSVSESAEKLGGTVAGRLITSGETHAVIDLTGLGFDDDAAARVALSASLRAWRYDRYRTRLKDKQKPTLEQLTVVAASEIGEHTSPFGPGGPCGPAAAAGTAAA